MTAPLATTSTPILASPKQQRPFSFAASASSSSSSLASRRRNNKNLSLCLSPSSPGSGHLYTTPVTPRTLEFESPKHDPYRHGPSRILPQLYLGAERNTLDLDSLRQLSVQCMLNVAEEVVHPQQHQFVTFEAMLDRPVPSPSLSRTSTASSIASSLHTIATNVFDMSPKSPRSLFDHSNSSTRFHLQQQQQQPFAYKKLPWKHNQENLVHELDAALAAIDQARDAGHTILVHCQCGVARSATVVIAYIMKRLQMPMQEAYDYVKVRAPGISPNLGLLYQLYEYEKKLFHTSTPTVPRFNLDQGTSDKAPATAVPPSPTAAAAPKKMFPFRKSSLSLSWKRRMAKTKMLSSSPGKEDVPIITPGLTRC